MTGTVYGLVVFVGANLVLLGWARWRHESLRLWLYGYGAAMLFITMSWLLSSHAPIFPLIIPLGLGVINILAGWLIEHREKSQVR